MKNTTVNISRIIFGKENIYIEAPSITIRQLELVKQDINEVTQVCKEIESKE